MDTTQTELFISPKRLTFLQRHAYWWMYVGLLISDVLSLSVSLGLGLLIRQLFFGPVATLNNYPNILPGLLGVTILIFAFQGLYITGGTNPVDELRSLSKSSSLAFLLLSAFTFLTQTSLYYSRFIFSLTWLFSLILAPAFRWGLRRLATRINLWGKPVIIAGNGKSTREIQNYLSNNRHIGWHPIAIIGNTYTDKSLENSRIPFYNIKSISQLTRYIEIFKTDTIIVVQSEVSQGWIDKMMQPSHQHLRKVIMISTFEGINNINVKTHDIAGTLGLEIKQNLLSRSGRVVKRGIDVCLVLVGGLIASPFIGLIAVLIKLDSKGSVFYGQTRVGYQGKSIRVWKFRTMVENADQILEDFLNQNPQLRSEWKDDHKLKSDPRITRVGHILRKLSLDEIPQIWNILQGEMSLIGPRPIVTEEIDRYGNTFELYKHVLPGLTGLWQVSGRNNTSYEQRVKLDGYYVQNWSMWLDIYILIKTVWVVISRDGAY